MSLGGKRSPIKRLAAAFIFFTLTGCNQIAREEIISTEFGDITIVRVASEDEEANNAGCLMAERLVSYELWTAVKNWAEDPARGGKVYSFANAGRRHGAYTIEGMPGEEQFEPVVDISWRDAMVWMNAFTEWYNEHAMMGENSATAGPFPLEPVYSTDDTFTEPIRRADNCPVTDDPFVNPDAAGFRLPSTASWERALRLEIPAYDEEGNPKRRWLFPDIDGLNSEWCFDRGPAGAETLVRSWRGGGEALRAVPCSCAASPPIRSMSPERTSGMLGFRFCKRR